MGFSAFFSKANFTVCTRLAWKYKHLKIYKPLKMLCLEERKLEVFMGSKDTYPKGSGMNMIIITPFGIY